MGSIPITHANFIPKNSWFLPTEPIKDLSKQQYIWVHNPEQNKVIKVEKLQEFLDNKWIIGRKKFN